MRKKKTWLHFDFLLLATCLLLAGPTAHGAAQCKEIFNTPSLNSTNQPSDSIGKGTLEIKDSNNLILKSNIGIMAIDPFTSFPESIYGLSDSSRRGHAHFAKWAAQQTIDLLVQIQQKQISPESLFAATMAARVQFAQIHEGMTEPTQAGFGESRVERSKHEQGEERVGLSSIGLDLKAATRPPNDYKYPEELWKRISKISTRTETANSVLRLAVEKNNLKMESSQNEVIVDRYYQTLDGNQIKFSSTKLQRIVESGPKPSYLVSLLNAPKSNVDLIMKDVYERIDIVMNSEENTVTNREHLIRAMQGYFCAMPYYRGTAAVGRVVFTSLFSAINRQQVTLHPEVDIKALSLEYGDFKEAYKLDREELPGEITGRLQSFKAYNKIRSYLGTINRSFGF